MTRLILIKHSLPVIDPLSPANTWQLENVGVQRCHTLATLLTPYLPAVLVSSPEPKASATANQLAEVWGIPWSMVPGLEEHHRRTVPFLEATMFRATIQRFFAQLANLVSGEETANAAHARFSGALTQVLDHHPNDTVMVVAHGTVIALGSAGLSLASMDVASGSSLGYHRVWSLIGRAYSWRILSLRWWSDGLDGRFSTHMEPQSNPCSTIIRAHCLHNTQHQMSSRIWRESSSGAPSRGGGDPRRAASSKSAIANCVAHCCK